MPFVFTIIAILFIVIGARGQSSNAIALLKSEFTGSGSFIQFLIAILIVGFIGYIKPLKLVSDGFLLLILISMFLADKGRVFSQFETDLQNTPPTPSPAQAASSSAGSSSGGSSSAGTTVSQSNLVQTSTGLINTTGSTPFQSPGFNFLGGFTQLLNFNNPPTSTSADSGLSPNML